MHNIYQYLNNPVETFFFLSWMKKYNIPIFTGYDQWLEGNT